MIEAAVMGFGTVGGGVVKVLEENAGIIRRSVREGIHVKYILDLREFPESPYRGRIVHDVDTILNDPSISIVCETMGGLGAAYKFTKAFLEKGISVCTSNKELVAAKGPELMETAKAHHCSYLFEASVGGGIPLLRTIITGLPQEDITSVTGILNGTTNYILTKMEKEGTEFDEALKGAQENGYAERDPSADVEGYDTARKIAIISSIVGGGTAAFEDVHCEGITKITPADLHCANALGCRVKLLAVMKKQESGKYSIITAPFLVPAGNALYNIDDVFNGILIHGTMVDDVLLGGRGAGREPTASAVVSDVIDAAKNKGETVPCPWDGSKKLDVADYRTAKYRFFVRVPEQERAAAAGAFGDITEVSEAEEKEFSFVTPELNETEFAGKAAGLTILSRIRML